jgi:hypothetical protein
MTTGQDTDAQQWFPIGISPVYETTDFDFAACLMLLEATRLEHMLPRSKRPARRGAHMEYRFGFVFSGLPYTEFIKAETAYVNGEWQVDPVLFMNKRAALRTVMERFILTLKQD